jgi:isoleucyl-tRNA synthetase
MPHAEGDRAESIFLNDMPVYSAVFAEETSALTAKWDKLFLYRDDVMKALELARAEKLIGKSLDAKVTVYANDDEAFETLNAFADKLAETYITSAAYVVRGDAPEGAFTETQTGIAVKVETADGCKCGRCWSYSTEGVTDEEGGFLCERCRKLLL